MFTRPHVLLFTAGLALLGGCASTTTPKVAVCDGKHRRPANIYGSVLPDAPLETSVTEVKPGAQPAPTPTPAEPSKPAPGAVSQTDRRSLLPCGRPA